MESLKIGDEVLECTCGTIMTLRDYEKTDQEYCFRCGRLLYDFKKKKVVKVRSRGGVPIFNKSVETK